MTPPSPLSIVPPPTNLFHEPHGHQAFDAALHAADSAHKSRIGHLDLARPVVVGRFQHVGEVPVGIKEEKGGGLQS